MIRRFLVLGILLLLSTTILSGCNFPSRGATEVPPIEAPTAVPTEGDVHIPSPMFGRDAVLVYLMKQYPDVALPEGLSWVEEIVTPEGLVGSSTFQYTENRWMITVAFPIVAPDATIYQVEVINHETGFQWQGEVNALGEITEKSILLGGPSIQGWMGYVLSTPEGAQFDDYVVMLPEGSGEFGVEGADEALENKIVELRDKEEPGKYAHFWGNIRCDLIDYGGCQFLVTKVRVGTEITEPEPIDGFEGKIFSHEIGSQFDDYFVLEGEFPVPYGISSFIAETGFPIYKDELEALRDTDQIIRVSGQLICGVPDSFGCQLQVNRIEVDGEEIDPYGEWITYTNDNYGYEFLYPSDGIITETGVQGFPAEDLPEGMTNEEYMAQLSEEYSDRLCVGAKIGYGYIQISAPPNQQFLYSICGRTGVGVGEMIDKTEEVFIAGKTYIADGFEFIGADETLPEHNETMVIHLDDGTRIEYGARPDENGTFEDYLLGAKLTILEILSTYTIQD